MALPAIRSIKAGRPDLHLTILTPAKLADLWKVVSEVDDIIIIPPKASPWQVAKLLKQRATSSLAPPFAAALLFPNSVRSALEVWLAKIPRRIGRVGKKRLQDVVNDAGGVATDHIGCLPDMGREVRRSLEHVQSPGWC